MQAAFHQEFYLFNRTTFFSFVEGAQYQAIFAQITLILFRCSLVNIRINDGKTAAAAEFIKIITSLQQKAGVR
ncbi:Hypothetical protein ABZS17D1_00099 [Kosakonia cowanii]